MAIKTLDKPLKKVGGKFAVEEGKKTERRRGKFCKGDPESTFDPSRTPFAPEGAEVRIAPEYKILRRHVRSKNVHVTEDDLVGR